MEGYEIFFFEFLSTLKENNPQKLFTNKKCMEKHNFKGQLEEKNIPVFENFVFEILF